MNPIQTIRKALESYAATETEGMNGAFRTCCFVRPNEPHADYCMTSAALAALSELEVQQPDFGAPAFKQVAPGIEVRYDLFGGVDIRLGGEFVYVHINYDYRYTNNSARAHLADQIVGLLTGKDDAPVAQQAEPIYVSCRCFDEVSKRLCVDKNRCFQAVAAGAKHQTGKNNGN